MIDRKCSTINCKPSGYWGTPILETPILLLKSCNLSTKKCKYGDVTKPMFHTMIPCGVGMNMQLHQLWTGVNQKGTRVLNRSSGWTRTVPSPIFGCFWEKGPSRLTGQLVGTLDIDTLIHYIFCFDFIFNDLYIDMNLWIYLSISILIRLHEPWGCLWDAESKGVRLPGMQIILVTSQLSIEESLCLIGTRTIENCEITRMVKWIYA